MGRVRVGGISRYSVGARRLAGKYPIYMHRFPCPFQSQTPTSALHPLQPPLPSLRKHSYPIPHSYCHSPFQFYFVLVRHEFKNIYFSFFYCLWFLHPTSNCMKTYSEHKATQHSISMRNFFGKPECSALMWFLFSKSLVLYRYDEIKWATEKNYQHFIY